MNRIRSTALVVAALAAFGSIAEAQVRPDKVPSDVLLYAEWSGLDAMSSGDTHFSALMADSTLDEVFRGLPGLITQVFGFGEPEVAGVLAQAAQTMNAVLTDRIRLYVGPFDPTAEAPLPKLALVMESGERAEAVHAELAGLLASAGGAPVLLAQGAGTVGMVTPNLSPSDLACLGFGDGSAESAAALAANPRFAQRAMQDAMATLWIDAQGILALVDGALPRMSPSDVDTWQMVRQVSGIGGLNEILVQGGFAGKNWRTRAFIGAPAPRKGVLSFLGGGGLSSDLLSSVPASARFAGGLTLDFESMLNCVIALASRLAPTAPDEPSIELQVQVAFDEVSKIVGFDVRKDFLGALGSGWTYYASREVGGTGVTGMVLVHQPKDPARLKESLVRMCRVGNDALAAEIPETPMRVKVSERSLRGVDMLVFNAPLFAPCIAFHEDRLFIALHPGVALGAIHSGLAGPRLSEAPVFARLRGEGDGLPSAFFYDDLPATMSDSYGASLMIPQLFAGGASFLGLEQNGLVLPPLAELLGHLEPVASTTRIDDTGLHVVSTEPFPGSQMLGANQIFGAYFLGSSLLTAPMMVFQERAALAEMQAMEARDAAEARRAAEEAALEAARAAEAEGERGDDG